MQRKNRIKNPTKLKKSCNIRQDDHFVVVDGIKLLSGYTPEEYQMHEISIRLYQGLVKTCFLQELELSTIAGIGKISNVNLHEDILANKVAFVPGVHSVTGRVNNPTKKEFRCQFTVNVQSDTKKDKIYKIKVFRNGKVHIPGIIHDEMLDVVYPLNVIRDFLRHNLESDLINAEYVKATMRNYRCNPARADLGIIIGVFKRCMVYEHSLRTVSIFDMYECTTFIRKKLGEKACFIFMKYVKWKTMPIKQPKRNAQKTSGILIKADRYREQVGHKDLTIRVLTSGKVTFNGGNSRIEVESSYWWLNFIINKYYGEAVYDPTLNAPIIPTNLDKLRFD